MVDFFGGADGTLPSVQSRIQMMVDSPGLPAGDKVTSWVYEFVAAPWVAAGAPTSGATYNALRLELLRRSSAYFADTMPALQIHHGTLDGVVKPDQSVRLRDQMAALVDAPPWDYHSYTGGQHNIGTLTTDSITGQPQSVFQSAWLCPLPTWPDAYCGAGLNNSGLRCRIGYTGTVSFARNDLVLTAVDANPEKSAAFFFGGAATQTPFGNGWRCVASGDLGTFRFNPPQFTNASGAVSRAVDNTVGPGVHLVAGSTRYFQIYYRDVGPLGPFNLSDGMKATFTP